MSTEVPRQTHFVEVKNRICKSLLTLAIVAFWGIALINIINQRPMINAALPLGAGMIILGMRYLAQYSQYMYPVKLVFMTFLCLIYFPLAWLTSPGSFSAMSFYAVMIVFVGIILAQNKWEYLFSLATIIQMLFMLYYETLHPEQYMLYTDMTTRAFDLGINFLVACLVIYISISILNRYFDDEHNRIFNVSITDQLTSIYNRSYLMQCLESIQFRAVREQSTYTILMMDLNHFKAVNDIYGHAVGDEVLIAFGQILKEASRSYDIPVRYGGDEFILVLPGTNAQQAKIVEARIQELFAPLAEKYKSIHLSVGIGIAENEGMPIEKIIKMADDHLYANKKEMKSGMIKE